MNIWSMVKYVFIFSMLIECFLFIIVYLAGLIFARRDFDPFECILTGILIILLTLGVDILIALISLALSFLDSIFGIGDISIIMPITVIVLGVLSLVVILITCTGGHPDPIDDETAPLDIEEISEEKLS